MSLVLAGCGGGAQEVTTLQLESSGVQANGVIRPQFLCGGGAIWIPLEWGKLPPETKELAIYFSRYRRERTNKLAVPYGDLIYHISPSVHRIAANTLPATIAWSDSGDINCPSREAKLNLAVELFAFDEKRFSRRLGHRLAVDLTKEALANAGSANKLGGEPIKDVVGIGSLVAAYRP